MGKSLAIEKAFDVMEREDVWKCLKDSGMEKTTVNIMKTMHGNNSNVIRVQNKESEKFQSKAGSKQRCILSPFLFSLVRYDKES